MKEATRAPCNHGRLYIFLCLCGLVLINILPLPYFGIGTGYSEPVFSITSTNEPLYEVLARISKATGYQIEITKNWENISITANLKNFTLEEVIKEVIRSIGRLNYAMTINDSVKKVEIKIFDSASGYPSVASKSPVELQQKQTEAALAPDAASTGQNEDTGANASTKTGLLDKEDLPPPPEVERGEDIAERASMERRMEAERASMERRMEAERASMESEIEMEMKRRQE